MNETKTRVRVVEVDDEPWQVLPGVGPRGLGVLVPQRIVVAVEGLPWDTLATLRRMRDRMLVTEVTIRRRGPDGLPQRAHRDLSNRDIVAAVRDVAKLARVVVEGDTVRIDEVAGRVPRVIAEQLARGHTKTQQSMRFMQKRAVFEYRKISRSGERYSDVYAEIGRRLNVSRATAHRYLQRAGEVGRSNR